MSEPLPYAVDSRELANYILDFCETRRWSCTQISLQKLMFFCHAWFLVKTGTPLVKQKFEAWDYGPVLQFLYREFRKFGDRPILERAKKLDRFTGESVVAMPSFSTEVRTTLNEVLEFYGRMSSSQLIELSHVKGGPWEKVWSNKDVNPGMRMENCDILRYYSNLYQHVLDSRRNGFQ